MPRSWFWQGMLAAVIVLPALADASRAQADCSDATLIGQYAFGVTAYLTANPSAPNSDGLQVFVS